MSKSTIQNTADDQVPVKGMGRAVLVPVLCVGIVVGMAGLAYAAVPLYRLFCQITGYGGTTQTAAVESDVILDRKMTVRFDANVNDLKWDFKPVEIGVDLQVGENYLAFYSAKNISEVTTTGISTFNVTPVEAGAYFSKIECFCFTEQTLAAGESVEMPVSFYIDPAIADDPELDFVKTITLSYTFFPSEASEDDKGIVAVEPEKPAANLN